MAKLSARGRTELVRLSREKTMPEKVMCDVCEGARVHKSAFLDAKEGDPCTVCDGTGEKTPLTCWEKKSIALMSDGKILKKLDVRFQPDMYDSKGRFHSYGWKVAGRVKAGVSPERFVEVYAKAGYVKE